jgi:hypothetical protein
LERPKGLKTKRQNREDAKQRHPDPGWKPNVNCIGAMLCRSPLDPLWCTRGLGRESHAHVAAAGGGAAEGEDGGPSGVLPRRRDLVTLGNIVRSLIARDFVPAGARQVLRIKGVGGGWSALGGIRRDVARGRRLLCGGERGTDGSRQAGEIGRIAGAAIRCRCRRAGGRQRGIAGGQRRRAAPRIRCATVGPFRRSSVNWCVCDAASPDSAREVSSQPACASCCA